MNILKEFWGGEREPEQRADVEVRNSDGTRLADSHSAENRAIPAQATFAVESVAGLFARAFGQADVRPNDSDDLNRLRGDLLSNIGRQLIRTGDVVVDRLTFKIACGVEIAGDTADDTKWAYRMEFATPSGSYEVTRLGSDVYHFRYADDPNGVQGLGPLDLSPTSAAMAGYLEDRLASECATPNMRVLRTINPNVHSVDYQDARQDDLAAAVHQARKKPGAVSVIFQSPNDLGGSNRPDEIHRLGPDVPAALVSLRQDVTASLLASMGIPYAVFERSGAASREALRAAIQTSVKPQADRVAREIARKTGLDVSLDLTAFASGDIASRARAVQSLVNAGVDMNIALVMADLEQANS